MVQIILWFENFQTSSIFIFLCLDDGNESETKENKNQTGSKIYKPKKNLNHDIIIGGNGEIDQMTHICP